MRLFVTCVQFGKTVVVSVSDDRPFAAALFLILCLNATGFARSPMLDSTARTAAERRRLFGSVGVMEPAEVAAALLGIVSNSSVASGTCVYVSASTGVFDPFAKQMQLWKDAVQAHRSARSRHARL